MSNLLDSYWISADKSWTKQILDGSATEVVANNSTLSGLVLYADDAGCVTTTASSVTNLLLESVWFTPLDIFSTQDLVDLSGVQNCLVRFAVFDFGGKGFNAELDTGNLTIDSNVFEAAYSHAIELTARDTTTTGFTHIKNNIFTNNCTAYLTSGCVGVLALYGAGTERQVLIENNKFSNIQLGENAPFLHMVQKDLVEAGIPETGDTVIINNTFKATNLGIGSMRFKGVSNLNIIANVFNVSGSTNSDIIIDSAADLLGSDGGDILIVGNTGTVVNINHRDVVIGDTSLDWSWNSTTEVWSNP